MEDSRKPIMIGVVVVCLAVAGLITYYTYSGGGGGVAEIPASEMIWVKCANEACKAEYQRNKRDYYKYVQERANPLSERAPAAVCQKCGKESVYQAEKCGNPQCGTVFYPGSVPADFPDRCPKCNRSETEESRKKRLSGQGG
jgi:hypothetical protein